MSILTTWGYTLTEVDAVPDMLTLEEFNEFTANKYQTDGRAEPDIKAAASAIRNYCGWEYDETYVLMPNGILRVYGLPWSRLRMWTPIEIQYTAGIPDGSADGLKELIAHRVTHALESSGGVQSETAGGVSITYNASWTNNARATALADDNKEVLSPYRLRGVF